MSSAEKGCLIGTHWMGVFYMEGFGVPQDFAKAEEFLKKATKLGNGQSAFQLFLLYCSEEKKNVPQAYKYLTKAVVMGVTFFDQMHRFFCENYEVLAPVYIEMKKPPSSVNVEKREDIENMHKGYVDEMKTTFSNALGKDRMYHQPCGYIEDKQIWMVGTLLKYAIHKALHFNHRDFITAVAADLSPLMGHTGLWVAQQYQARQLEKGNEELKKKARVFVGIIENYMENGLDQLGDEKKYHRMNKYSAGKLPEQAVKRSECVVYSWSHYAPAKWVEYLQKSEKEVKMAQEFTKQQEKAAKKKK